MAGLKDTMAKMMETIGNGDNDALAQMMGGMGGMGADGGSLKDRVDALMQGMGAGGEEEGAQIDEF